MKKNELKIEYVPIEMLEPYANNTRKHEQFDVDQIAKSIDLYGFNNPIAIWSDHNVIVSGHGRLMGAKKLGLTHVPVVRLDHLTDKERKAYAVMDNKTAEFSKWDFDALRMELPEINLDAFDFDFTLPDANEMFGTEQDDFDETDLDATEERGEFVYTLKFASKKEFDNASASVKKIADDFGANVSVKMG